MSKVRIPVAPFPKAKQIDEALAVAKQTSEILWARRWHPCSHSKSFFEETTAPIVPNSSVSNTQPILMFFRIVDLPTMRIEINNPFQ